jgi:hypothetical protein
MDVENADLTAVGLIAKLEEIQEAEGGVSRFIYNDAQKRLMEKGFRMPPGIQKVAKECVAGERVLAINRSYYSWEDFSDEKTAEVLLDESSGRLRLSITEKVENTGMNPHKRSEVLEDVEIGTLTKPKLGNVASLLKKHGHDSTSAGGPFKARWMLPVSGERMPLKQILDKAMLDTAASQPSPAAPATKRLLTDYDAKKLKVLLFKVDQKTIEVEEATEKALKAIAAGDQKQSEYALGFLHTTIESLRDSCRDYQEQVGEMSK